MTVWSSNLVTIRFELEVHTLNLPSIYHKLCWNLANILGGHSRLCRFHITVGQRINSQVSSDIWTELELRKTATWNSCVKILEECLDEYVKFADKKQLFDEKGNDAWDAKWHEDLLGLEDVVRLTNQFLSLRKEFLQDCQTQRVNDGILLRQKLLRCLRKHLKAFHVEAMNSLGMAMYLSLIHI